VKKGGGTLISKRFPTRRLRRIAEAKGSLINAWKEGASIEADSGETVDDLMRRIATDRLRLARIHKRHAQAFISMTPPQYRSGVSRFYYAMYHAMRACAYLYHKGDDHNAHADLPLKIPQDFPTSSQWQTKLKEAHLARNMADYDPYPMDWKTVVRTLGQDADDLIAAARIYLKNMGCKT
jgi:uncharacterized protein (UPF0332 family)